MSTQSAYISIVDEDLTRYDRGCLGCGERWKWGQSRGRGRRSGWHVPTVII